MFDKKTIRDIDVARRTVLLRTDYNVPISGGIVSDDFRIRQSLPTIEYLRTNRCKVVICSHLGRPGGRPAPDLSLDVVADRLRDLTGVEVQFVPEAVGPQVEMAVKQLQPTQILMLENLRFYPGEEGNDRDFARRLSQPVEYFVQDAFGVVHRQHASTVAITEFLPAVAGLLVEKEVKALRLAIENPIRPLVAIIGGAKITDKIDLIEKFILRANTIIIGGAMANTFLKASGYEVGKSVIDEAEIGEAKRILKEVDRAHVELILPTQDLGVAYDVSQQAERRDVPLDQVSKDDIILDFGEESLKRVLSVVEHAGSVIWNGPLGMYEIPAFAYGSETLAKFIAEKKINCIVGGGDTAGLVHSLGLNGSFTHVSTGGGASLELLSGKELPGVNALLDR